MSRGAPQQEWESSAVSTSVDDPLIARGIFTSVADLGRKIRRYIASHNKDPKPIRWTDSDPTYRITTRSAGTGH
jgi:hypothetical protein